MNNPLEILRAFDAQLEKPTDLTLYGRSAIALGYSGAPDKYRRTQDVDAILPLAQLEILREDSSFWMAQERVNKQLAAQGLYLTHLFSELDVIIPPDWVTRRVAIPGPFQKLKLFRPATVDLIITKMMRDDRQDLDDIRFLLEQEPLPVQTLEAALASARIPDVAEFREIFWQVRPKVLAIAQRIEQNRSTQ